MKYLVVLALLVCLVGCGGNPLDPAAPKGNAAAPPPSLQPPPLVTYDMLEWMAMSPDLSVDHHMAGTANPVYTNVQSDRFFWTKTGQGYPWDIQLYDNKYIYLWVTELDWHNPRTYKVFHSPTLGNFNLPFAPRTAQGGFPGSTITITDSTYEIHTDCDTYTTKSLGNVVNEVWGPYYESLGGDLPDNLQTLVVSYRYSCDKNFDNCKDKEEFHLAKPYGLVKWDHAKLQSDGTYAAPDNVTYLNKVEAGQVQPMTSCF
jgi:hypothetical protein